MRGATASGIVVLGAWLASTATADVPTRNGFALAPSSVPTAEILAGGPARDGIPALDHPAADRETESLWSQIRAEAIVAYDARRRAFDVEAPPEIEVVEGHWFAWAAFHPETSVYTAGAALPPGD
jgi:hypothetical protein